jgi:hypothetical protein
VKRLLSFVTLSVVSLVSLAADDRVFLFEESLLSDLKSKERLVFVNKTAGEPENLPNAPFFQAFLKQKVPKKCKLSFESVYLLDSQAAKQDNEGDEDFHSRLIAASMDLESLEGLEYYSESNKKMKPLYKKSSFLDAKPSVPKFLNTHETYTVSARVKQEDTSFGDNIYRYDWLITKDLLVFSSRNETALSYGLLRAAPEEGFVNITGIFHVEGRLILYSLTAIETASFLPGFMVDRVKISLVNRMDALKTWFEARISQKKAD